MVDRVHHFHPASQEAQWYRDQWAAENEQRLAERRALSEQKRLRRLNWQFWIIISLGPIFGALAGFVLLAGSAP